MSQRIDTTGPATRQTRKSETRQALKQAALACFAEGGIEATSVGAVTRRAGVAHGTFYVHFPTKEALLDELLADFNRTLVAALEPVWAEPQVGHLEALVRRSAEVFLDVWSAERAFIEVYAGRLSQGLSLQALRDGINPQLETFLRERLAALWGSAVDAGVLRLAVQGLLALWSRIGMQVLFGPDVERGPAVELLVDMTLGGLARLARDAVPGARRGR